METSSSLSPKSFFRSLYDFHFVSLIASRFIKFLYACSVIGYSIAYGILFIVLLTRGGPGVVLGILLIPFYVLSLIWLRIFMEFLIVIFHIAEDVRAMRTHGGSLLGLGVSAPRLAIDGVANPATTAAGWYDAPGDGARLRYWDGTSWTGHYAPKSTSAQQS